MHPTMHLKNSELKLQEIATSSNHAKIRVCCFKKKPLALVRFFQNRVKYTDSVTVSPLNSHASLQQSLTSEFY